MAVVGRQGLAVHLVRKDHVVQRLGGGQGAADAAEGDAVGDHLAVEAAREHVDGFGAQSGAAQHVKEAGAAPAGLADHAEGPGGAADLLALLGGEVAAAVAGALQEGGAGDGGQGAQFVEGEAERAAGEAVAVDGELPGGRVDARGVGVVADEEVAGRGEVAGAGEGGEAGLGVGAAHGEHVGGERTVRATGHERATRAQQSGRGDVAHVR
ncbi:hypothetical protein WQ59_22050 [Streptomyces sp. KE1]|nr:hypothetical protein WQ59_22050 [Streptomyces sp. KE1]